MTDIPDKASALALIEGRYLTEYVAFAGQIREYANDTLGQAFRADPNPRRRRHHVVQLVQLEYAAYEDAAALLKAFLGVRGGDRKMVFEVLESYRPGEAVIDTVLTEQCIRSGEDLYTMLRLEEIVPAEWNDWFPHLDLPKALRLACQFLAVDCRANHKSLGIAAYNKSKHGPLVVARGDIFPGGLAPVPSMFFANKWPALYGPNPVIVYGFPDDDASIEERSRCIHFVQHSLRLIVASLLASLHADEVRARWGGARAMWDHAELRDVLAFINEVTRKK